MNLATPLVVLLTLLVILSSLLPTPEPAEPANSASFELYTVRPDGLCLYVKKNRDGSFYMFEDKTRKFTDEELRRPTWAITE